MAREGLVAREHRGVYRLASVPRSSAQRLHAALAWAGPDAAAAGRSSGRLYRLDGVTVVRPEIVVPSTRRLSERFGDHPPRS
jgi:hypothetical protein